jgi:hypothetical protein
MTKPTPRSDLVKAVSDAKSILDEAIPLAFAVTDDINEGRSMLRAAAMPVIPRELLDVEVIPS